jgi:uncharacterized membrane protein (DUF4010 family)
MDLSIALRLAIALALGLIIGIEREWASRDTQEGLRSAGVRSFGFVGLLGGVSALLAGEFGVVVLAIAFLGLVTMVGLSYAFTAPKTEDYGTTTELALLIAFGLGALAMRGFAIEATGVAVVTAALLGAKQELHGFLRRLDRRELTATLQLLLIAAVLLPLLPNRDLGPWEALNPRTIGLLILLIAGISYVGYFAVRLLGTRVGILLTAALGGLTSSTAVTVAFARMAQRDRKAVPLLGAGIALAAATMAPRLLLEVGVINRSLLDLVALPIALLAVVPLLAALAIARLTAALDGQAEIAIGNPLELKAALGFGAALTGLFVLIRAAEAEFGNAGVYALAAISGSLDVDAVGISLAQAAGKTLTPSVAATGLVTAALVNTAVKAILATAIGGWALARWCATILMAALFVSAIAAILVV